MSDLVSIGFDISAQGIKTASDALDKLLNKAGSLEGKLATVGSTFSKSISSHSDKARHLVTSFCGTYSRQTLESCQIRG